MNCQNCGSPATLEVGPPDARFPLCIDCNLKLQQAAAIRHAMIVDERNDLLARSSAITGLPSLRPPLPRAQVLRFGDTTLNNIIIQGSTIGILNTGYLGAVDGAITILGEAGKSDAAEALQGLTEAVTNSADVDSQFKNEALELLSLLAAEASAPQDRRRSKAMLAIAEKLSSLLQGAAALSDLSARWLPPIMCLFQ